MKMLIVIAMLFYGLAANAQKPEKCDTIPVFILSVDSSRIFASYPVYEYKTHLEPGWRVICEGVEIFFDREGIEFPESMVLFYKKRVHTPNKFKG